MSSPHSNVPQDQLKNKDSWGLLTLKADKPKWDVIVKYGRTKFNTRRYDFKKAVSYTYYSLLFVLRGCLLVVLVI